MATFSAKHILRASGASLADIEIFDWSGQMRDEHIRVPCKIV